MIFDSATQLLFIRYFLGLAFVVSATSKLHSPASIKDFAVSVRSMLKWTRTPGSLVVASGVAATEMVVAIALLSGYFLRSAFTFLIALLTLFTGLLVNVVREKRDVQCRCFGRIDARVGLPDIARNALLFALAVVGFALSSDQHALSTAPLNRVATLLIASNLLALTLGGSDVRYALTALFHARVGDPS